jgi:hypothetical protein
VGAPADELIPSADGHAGQFPTEADMHGVTRLSSEFDAALVIDGTTAARRL